MPLNIDWDGNGVLQIYRNRNDIIYKLEEEVDHELLKIGLDKLTKRERKIMELIGLNTDRKNSKKVADIGISQSIFPG